MRNPVEKPNNPGANCIFDFQKHGPNGSHDIMQRNGNDRRDGIAAQKIREPHAEKGLQPEKRSEAHEHPDRHPASERVGGVMQIEQFGNKCPEVPGDFFQHPRTLPPIPPPEKTEIHSLGGEQKFWTIVQIFCSKRTEPGLSIPLQSGRRDSSFYGVRFLICAVVAFLFPALGSARAALEVVCTTGMVADLVRSVAGERANVTTLISDGVDPHLYKPTRDDVARLLKTDVIVYSGFHLEGRMEATFEKMRQRGKTVCAVTSSIPPDKILKEGNAKDPHVWMDPLVWAGCIEAVESTLTQADLEGREIFQANAARYRASLEAVSEWMRTAISTIPEGQRVLITAHDAFQYFGRATGLQVMGLQGLSTESEAGVADINRIVDEIVKRRIPAVFFESTLSEKNIRAVIEGAAARGQVVKPGGMLYSDSLGAPGTPEGTCEGMLRHNTRTIANALGGHVP